MTHELTKSFEAYGLIKSATDAPNGNKYLAGPAALVEEDKRGKDFDGEDLTKAAVEQGLVTFDRLGANVDWDHLWSKTRRASCLIGRGVKIEPNPGGGAPIVTTELFMNKAMGREAWEHYESGGNLAYSLQGIATARDPENRKRVTGMQITMLTITPMPKGYEGPRLTASAPPSLGMVMKGLTEEVETGDLGGWESIEDAVPEDAPPVLKALTTGAGIALDGATGGQVLRTQALRGGGAVETSFGSGKKCRCGKHKGKCACKKDAESKRPITKSVQPSALVAELAARGAKHPQAIANLLTRQR